MVGARWIDPDGATIHNAEEIQRKETSEAEHDITVFSASQMVDHIPVIWRWPQPPAEVATLALWRPALGQDKEGVASFLDDLAAAGFVAVSFDLWQHGERGSESRGHQGRGLRPIPPLQVADPRQTTLDALRVIDWALGILGGGASAVAGGISRWEATPPSSWPASISE
jgi:hypothetical protein